MKLSELNKIGRGDSALAEIRTHTETLRAMVNTSGDRAEHYLLWTNGGAVIALLSFMAASARIRELPSAWNALSFFVAGVMCCGLLCAVNYHVRLVMFQRWVADSDRFCKDAIDTESLYGSLNRLANGVWSWISPAFGWLAFACFITGAVIALTNFIPHPATSGRVCPPGVHRSCFNPTTAKIPFTDPAGLVKDPALLKKLNSAPDCPAGQQAVALNNDTPWSSYDPHDAAQVAQHLKECTPSEHFIPDTDDRGVSCAKATN